jgi:hypothetical protein
MRKAALAVALTFALGVAAHGLAWAQAEAPSVVDAVDAVDAAQTLVLAGCITHLQGAKAPEYPRAASRANRFGRVFATLHFDAPDRAPEVELLHRPRADALGAAVRSWARDLRMPCHAGQRVSVKQSHQFFFQGESPGFKSLRLPDLLALARHRADRQPFDTAGMPCPMQVSWTYLQPQHPNRVRIQGEPHPAHAPVHERLARMDLALTGPAGDMAWGATAQFEIPCQPPESITQVHKE